MVWCVTPHRFCSFTWNFYIWFFWFCSFLLLALFVSNSLCPFVSFICSLIHVPIKHNLISMSIFFDPSRQDWGCSMASTDRRACAWQFWEPPLQYMSIQGINWPLPIQHNGLSSSSLKKQILVFWCLVNIFSIKRELGIEII
jgi:hypothetical protein